MSKTSLYWENKKERAKRAERHTKEMEAKYYREILESVKKTKTYSPDSEFNQKGEPKQPETMFLNTDTVTALFARGYGKVAVLNFASYKNPGGMFLKGSKAQEECLCHSSFLYNVLRNCKEYYQWNNDNKNRALYLDRALYNRNVRFFSEDESLLCDVITCAAPNWSAAQKFGNATKEENNELLKDRIQFIKNIAEDNRDDVIILGAWGAGVFGQDAEIVAKYMSEIFSETTIKRVVFAVPGNDENYTAFKNVFEK